VRTSKSRARTAASASNGPTVSGVKTSFNPRPLCSLCCAPSAWPPAGRCIPASMLAIAAASMPPATPDPPDPPRSPSAARSASCDTATPGVASVACVGTTSSGVACIGTCGAGAFAGAAGVDATEAVATGVSVKPPPPTAPAAAAARIARARYRLVKQSVSVSSRVTRVNSDA
jgi:hypothetical protein